MKKILLMFGIGLAIALFIIFFSTFLNMRHSSPGSAETLNIPSWVRGSHTTFGAPVLGIIIQVCCLVIAIKSYFAELNNKLHKIYLYIAWTGMLLISLFIWLLGTLLVMASWCV